MSQEKTEQPTGKRLQDAREKGQVARSRDLALAAASVAATIAVAKMGGRLATGMAERLSRDLAHFGDTPLKAITAGDINGRVIEGAGLIALLVWPIALATMTVGVAMHGLQGGWSFAPEALQFSWSRLNPASGMKRFGLMKGGVETIKAIVSVSMITYLAWNITDAVMADAVRLAWQTPLTAAILAWNYADSLLWRVAWGLGILSLADYGLQKYRHTSSLKMSKQEIRDEHRMAEGSPENKKRVRRAQMEMSRRRMMRDVSRATVVITNPTHFAVALEYRREKMAAPIVLAKGIDEVALRIREEARSHGIPIIENKALAQTLYRTAEIGDTIPAPLFGAVAEVLAYLVRIKQLML
ncbi:MAG TPA: EscU/YscU/HrcU family type III secretion system export apparatus switch protein [Vicinamibacterales bacterium]|nr:EscU/YscU/HrcU family type III secretion system export apparatus switch protein [Vicinamibacterales bacterium]